jgi:hypothetical protein
MPADRVRGRRVPLLVRRTILESVSKANANQLPAKNRPEALRQQVHVFSSLVAYFASGYARKKTTLVFCHA